MKVVFFNKLNRLWLENIEKLRVGFNNVSFVTDRDRLDHELEDADALVGGEWSREALGLAKRLNIIFVPYTGINGLPLDLIRERGIRVSNIHANAAFVAERAMAMVLCSYGKISAYHEDLKRGKWHGFWAKAHVKDTWHSIQGRSCAVIGVGAIGRELAKLLKAFNCRIIGVKKRPVEKTPDPFDHLTCDLTRAIGESELVFITLPLTPETRNLISEDILLKMKGKFLVNVGRGPVVSEKGLYRALKEGILKGAAIDVWYTYPEKGTARGNPSRYPIHELPNVMLSPHLAGFTPESSVLSIAHTLENIRAYLETGRAKSEVDPRLLY